MTNTDTDTFTALSANLGAISYAGGSTYGLLLSTGEVCLASPEQLADLGARLADRSSVLSGALDRGWAEEHGLEFGSPAEVAANFPDLDGEEVDLDALRAEAGSVGDLLTVATVDLAGPALARAFEAEEADDADDAPVCAFLPVASAGRAGSTLPILPTHVYVSAGGSAVAAYDGAEDEEYPSIDALLGEHQASFTELVGDELSMEDQPTWITDLLAEEAAGGEDDAAEAIAEARYLDLLGEAFPLESLCDLDADPPAGDDALRASTGGHPDEWYVFDTSGQVWRPGDVARAALLRASAVGGYDLDAAAVALCHQAPSLGVWHT